jgi:Tfp pilus assembly protein PilO
MKWLDIRAHLGRIAAILAGLVVINLLFLNLVNRPRAFQARTADETTAVLAGQVAREQERVAHWQERADELQRSREALQRFFDEDLSTKSQRLVAVQKEIHRIAQTYQVQASQLKFTHDQVEGTDLIQLGVNIPLSGGYRNLRQFINSVEKSELFLIVQSIQLQEGERGGVLLNLNVRLTTYFADDDGSVELRYRLEG